MTGLSSHESATRTTFLHWQCWAIRRLDYANGSNRIEYQTMDGIDRSWSRGWSPTAYYTEQKWTLATLLIVVWIRVHSFIQEFVKWKPFNNNQMLRRFLQLLAIGHCVNVSIHGKSCHNRGVFMCFISVISLKAVTFEPYAIAGSQASNDFSRTGPKFQRCY